MRENRDVILFVGCGNCSASDDAVGPALVSLLASKHRGSAALQFLMMPSTGVEALELFAEERPIVFVDAVQSGREPGMILLTPLPVSGVEQRSAAGGAGWSVSDLLALARSTGRHVPPTALLGIEVDGRSSRPEFSEPVDMAMGFIVDNFAEIRSMCSTRELLAFAPEEAAAAIA